MDCSECPRRFTATAWSTGGSHMAAPRTARRSSFCEQQPPSRKRPGLQPPSSNGSPPNIRRHSICRNRSTINRFFENVPTFWKKFGRFGGLGLVGVRGVTAQDLVRISVVYVTNGKNPSCRCQSCTRFDITFSMSPARFFTRFEGANKRFCRLVRACCSAAPRCCGLAGAKSAELPGRSTAARGGGRRGAVRRHVEFRRERVVVCRGRSLRRWSRSS